MSDPWLVRAHSVGRGTRQGVGILSAENARAAARGLRFQGWVGTERTTRPARPAPSTYHVRRFVALHFRMAARGLG